MGAILSIKQKKRVWARRRNERNVMRFQTIQTKKNTGGRA
jgi:hypothetical protein